MWQHLYKNPTQLFNETKNSNKEGSTHKKNTHVIKN